MPLSKAASYLGDTVSTLKDWTVDAIKETADLIVGEVSNALNVGDTTPLEQMRGSVVIGAIAFGSSLITFGATMGIVIAAGFTFLWGFGRWLLEFWSTAT